MSVKESRLGLGEAFQRTDENGNFIPRQRPSPREGAVGTISDSRIPRTTAFSPTVVKLSPRGNFDNEGKLGQRQGRLASMPLDSEDDTGTRDGSPSPAPKDRRWSRDESGSDGSQLSLVENATLDNFDQKMSQYTKDQTRMKNIMSNQKGIYTRVEVGPRVAETTRTLVKKTSESSLEAEPPVRPPRTWGSKARRSDAWMQKILSPDTSLELKDAPEDQDLVPRHRTEVDVPIPSVEDLSSIQNPTPPASRPTSALPNNASPEKSQMWDADLDFTARSLQISTSPQLRVRSAKIDDIRDREIQTLSARAVATNRLEEIRERNSEDRSLNTGTVQPEVKESLVKVEKTPESEEPYHEMTILEEEGEHIRGTPITLFSRAAYESHSRSDSSSREKMTGRGTNHSRDDSRELLRRLSRTASHSPSPLNSTEGSVDKESRPPSIKTPDGKEENTATAENKVVKSEKPAYKTEGGSAELKAAEAKPEKAQQDKGSESSSRSSGLDLDVKRFSRASTPPKSDVDPEERIEAEARLFDLQDNRSERNSVKASSRSPSPASEDGQFDETPRPKQKADPLSLPTPRITGAYIETPAPTTRKPRKSRSISPHYEVVNTPDAGSASDNQQAQEPADETNGATLKDRPRRQLRRTSSLRALAPQSIPGTSRPPLINTATPGSVAEDLRRIQQEVQLEDSTLDDFDALLEAEVRTSIDTNNNTTILEPVIDLEYDERGRVLSEKAIERRIERLHLERMSQSIKNTSSSIRDARQGIERLEEQVSSSIPTIRKSEDSIYIKIPVPRLWFSQPPQKPGMKPGWKLTWLGFILAIFFGWYISEAAMCSQFCHPEQSTVNTWQPSDPFFPWAIPTKLDQWTGKIASTTAANVWESLGGWKPARDRYRGGPLGSSDWWLGRDGPVGLKFDDEGEGMASMYMDETIDV
jgi:hypothetical protein